MRQIMLDTETTGLSPQNGDRIVELGCVELLNRKLTGNNKHYYLNPERESDEGALRVHGLTSDFLRDKPKFAEIADDFLDYIAGAEVIIHNAPFDLGFLEAELAKAKRNRFTSVVAKVVDSLAMAKHQYPGKRNSLDALCDRLGVDNSGRKLHGALLDAELLADVYIGLTRGQDALLMDAASEQQTATAQTIDFSQFELITLQASESEIAEHEAMLLQLDKASSGKTIWRTLQPTL
ncbi:MAG: DNA polymerase III subunit epsilon [Cytophagales bacterium]|nr:DNA polymerase III subunit epsilon [Cytophagales bacterium]